MADRPLHPDPAALLPADEAARLAELRAFAALDTGTDGDIDELAALAARLCGTPLALVSLVDADRQWFRSCHGMTTGPDLPRDVSFCTHALGASGVFEVRDALADPRFAGSPLVTGPPHVRFYAGAPLRTATGHTLGALCVMGHEPGALTSDQRDHLQLLGRQVMRRLEYQRSLHELQRLGEERDRHVQQMRAASAAIARSEERLSMLMGAVHAGYWDWDLDSGLVSVSPRFAEMFQLEADGPLPIEEIFTAVDDQELEALHAALARLLEGRVDRLRHELRLRAGADEPVWLRMRGQVIARTPSGEPRRALGLAIDITTERIKDDHLRAVQKLDSIGALAAGVAHEINTPLQFVSHNLDFLAAHAATVSSLAGQLSEWRDRAVPPATSAGAEDADLEFVREEFAGAIAESIDGIDRVSTIVRALKEFSHPGGGDPRPVDMNRMIDNAVTLTRNEWKFVATVERDLAPDLPPVPWAAYECGQLLVNLLVNAAHAVQAAVRPGERGRIAIRTRAVDGHAEIRISDTGTGVPADIRDRIFEPFFTTKPVGKGTGQGLSTAKTIVERHGGTISLETEVGVGSAFTVRLPLALGRRAA